MANEMKTEMERLKRFLKGYESEPEPQEIDKISGDFQLAGLKPLIDQLSRFCATTPPPLFLWMTRQAATFFCPAPLKISDWLVS